MSNWYYDQYTKDIPSIDENDQKLNEFDKWISDDLRSFDDLGKYGWPLVRIWMHYKGVYVLPTVELVDYILEEFFPENEWTDERIDKEVIEICSGRGMLGRSLGIRMTDSKLQATNKNIMMYYQLANQPLIKYPSDVMMMDANDAVNRLHPHTVIGSYVTWGSRKKVDCYQLGASYYGPDLMKIYDKVSRIILIGNLSILAHTTYPINMYPYKEITDVPGLITRSDPNKNVILIWTK